MSSQETVEEKVTWFFISVKWLLSGKYFNDSVVCWLTYLTSGQKKRKLDSVQGGHKIWGLSWLPPTAGFCICKELTSMGGKKKWTKGLHFGHLGINFCSLPLPLYPVCHSLLCSLLCGGWLSSPTPAAALETPESFRVLWCGRSRLSLSALTDNLCQCYHPRSKPIFELSWKHARSMYLDLMSHPQATASGSPALKSLPLLPLTVTFVFPLRSSSSSHFHMHLAKRLKINTAVVPECNLSISKLVFEIWIKKKRIDQFMGFNLPYTLTNITYNSIICEL